MKHKFPSESDSAISDGEGVYFVKFGQVVERTGKIYSYTFWRTQIGDEIFWTIQGADAQKPTWIVTKYFGAPKNGRKYLQEVTLKHPKEDKVKIVYTSNCFDEENRIEISKYVLNQFKNKDNTFDFEFRIVKIKRKCECIRML